MKTLFKIHVYLLLLFFGISCQKEKSLQRSNAIKDTATIIEVSSKEDNVDISNRPKQSRIIKSNFDLNLLFGIWTIDPQGPHADFELSKQSFYLVDYDGDGNMPYTINEDTLKVYFPDFENSGIIKKATKDSLIIEWSEAGLTKYVKWKN